MKLKTLKDLPSYINNATVDKSILKTEVIKWIKEESWLYDPQRIIICWIKHFFNITEEELKWKK